MTQHSLWMAGIALLAVGTFILRVAVSDSVRA